LGIPPETAPLLLIRPLSGSGALAVANDIIRQNGADSTIGRIAAVMLGSTETTFYTVSVYLGAAGIKKSRYAVPAALMADIAAFAAAGIAVRLLFRSA
jgi:spore maturation protein B